VTEITADHGLFEDTRLHVDALFPVPDVKQQSLLYTGSSKVTFATLPRSAHALTLESEHGKLEAVVAKFLSGDGL
jgi:hypothetical protein